MVKKASRLTSIINVSKIDRFAIKKILHSLLLDMFLNVCEVLVQII